MPNMRAVVVDPADPNRLVLKEVPAPTPAAGEALVRVDAFSLNRGEVRSAMAAQAGARPGWDLAGTVGQAAADGSGPAAGTRVVGFVASGSWAELVAVPTHALAALPDAVSFSDAATLPVAGLTALHALERGGSLLARQVLVTGASGGVGLFACRLAQLSGARVVGLIRKDIYRRQVESFGAEVVVVSDDAGAAEPHGPYRLIVESVGGPVLAGALSMLGPDGECVSFGATAAADVTFNLWSLVRAPNGRLSGLSLFTELKREPASVGLARLVHLVATQRLRPHLEIEVPWTEIGPTAQRLLGRGIAGKAVLHVGR